MKVQESFHIAEPPQRLWAFFEQVDEVARCVPGIESVEVVDDENSKIRVTQSVGPMTATFDLKMRIIEREVNERLAFTVIGRAVKGAAGNLRTTNTVRLTAVDEGTRVDLESDLAMGGVMGSLGQKVVAKQAAAVTKQFAASLERVMTGEPAEPAGGEPVAPVELGTSDAAGAPRSTNGAGPSPSSAATALHWSSDSRWRPPPALAAVLGGLLLAALVILSRAQGRR